MRTGPVTTHPACPAQDWPRGKVTSGPTAQPVSTLVRLEGLTEGGRRAAGRGYLRGPVHAWMACGWWTCVVLLDLRRLLMARVPSGPVASCTKGKQAHDGGFRRHPCTQYRVRRCRTDLEGGGGCGEKGGQMERPVGPRLGPLSRGRSWASISLPFLERSGSPSPLASGRSERKCVRPGLELQQRLCVPTIMH